MALSWNEIKSRAIEFSKEWENDFNEHAEAKSFMDAFFNVFGISRRRVATFEEIVRKEDGRHGFIDLLWKGNILIEFKSRSKSLDKAHQQAKDYFPGIKDADLPKFILVCDFERFRLYDLEENTTLEFTLSELVNNVQHFGYLLGYQRKTYKEQDPANIEAAELMGKLHDRLEEIGYTGHPLEIYLVRLLFCLFAEDTTIFNKQQFQDFIEQRTNEDGADLAPRLHELFQTLNTPKEQRLKNLDEQLSEFPYVNGKLFEEMLPIASFDAKMRHALLNCCHLNWSKISPAIFGSMFQSVMKPIERRNLGAHYTSETNILKLIKPLFLDDLWKEFESIKDNPNKLHDFHQRLSKMKFLDPACGCGNFLVITYRELRLLEIEILRTLKKKGEAFLNVGDIVWLDVDMMYGIEFEEFPARIAEVAMWLIDHQMNMAISNEFGQYFVRLPLRKSATIVQGNALRMDWEGIVSKNELSFILGNPPFLGKKEQSPEQKADMERLFAGVKGSGVLDYVTAWYLKAAQLIQGTKVGVAFVSTNSISQGEQVGILWPLLLDRFNIKIHFAHRTFKWSNEAKGNAAVFCVIIGFSDFDKRQKTLFEYQDVRGKPQELRVTRINPYLVDAPDIVLQKRSTPICSVPKMVEGITPLDNGILAFSEEEYLEFIEKEPGSRKWFKPWITGRSFINRYPQYCLWMTDIKPEEIRSMPLVAKKVREVKEFRESSKSSQQFSSTPWLFRETSIANTYILVPKTSSESRRYIPMGFITDGITSSSSLMINEATIYHFGVLMSLMHMAWVKNVGGRLKSDYRYSKDIVYNNFPWPENPTEKQVITIETAAQRVLDARDEFPVSSLADLYDPLTMPLPLVKAHNNLDKVVDLAYRAQPFTSDANRMVFLFDLYEKYTSRLFSNAKKKRTK